MLSELFLSSVSGPPLSNNTTVAKDVGIYLHALSPMNGIKGSFKKSSCPRHCLAANDSHVFAAQQDKAYVHVYSRQKGTQEAFVPFPERIRSLLLVKDVLVLGTQEGQVLLWEVCTGRLVSTPHAHIQAVSCMAATRHHLITGSDDSNLHVWPLARLLRLDTSVDPQPDRTLSHHRGAVTSVVASTSSNTDTSLCVTTSRDKTCIVWNYSTGDALRTVLFPVAPLCAAIDPFPRLLVISTDDGLLYVLDLFGEKPIVGSRAPESWSTVMKAPSAIAQASVDQGPASCLALSHDGNTLLSGHSKGQIVRWSLRGHGTELASLNAAITNLVFIAPLPHRCGTRTVNIVKPSPSANYSPYVRLEKAHRPNLASRFDDLVNTAGVPPPLLWDAIAAVDPEIVNAESAKDTEDADLLQTLIHLDDFAKVSPT